MSKEVVLHFKCELCGDYRMLKKDNNFQPPMFVCFDCHLTRGNHARKSFKKLPKKITFKSR